VLFSSLIAGFLLDCRARNLSKHTILTYDSALRLICNFLEDPPPEAVTLSDLRRYSLDLQERHQYAAGHHPWMTETQQTLSPWTVHHNLRPAKTLFAWATTEELLPANPAERLRLPKLPKGCVDRFTDEEIDRLLEVTKSPYYRDYAIVFLLLDSGLRRGELAALAVADVDMTTGLITVQHGKGDKWRQVRVGDVCRKVLWIYINKHRSPAGEDETALFLSDRGSPMTGNALGCLFRRLSAELGFRVYAHKFRHTFATN